MMVSQKNLQLHRRQFLISHRGEAFVPPEGWVFHDLAGAALWRSEKLPCLELVDARGRRWFLLGRAVALDPSAEPETVIAGWAGDEPPGAVHRWTGRWLLIGPRFVVPDASALLGCLYCFDAGRAPLISSSLALLASTAPETVFVDEDSRTLVYERGLSWRPPPRTRFVGVRRLLPSQILDWRTGEVAPWAPLPPITPTDDVEVVTGKLIEMLSTALDRLPGGADAPLQLGLTAGYDSRLVLALASAQATPVRAHTRITRRMSLADRLMPPRLARLAGVPFELQRDAPPAGDRGPLIQAHALDPPSQGDLLPILSGARDGLKGIGVGGHGFAIASGFSNWRRLPDELPDPEDGARLMIALMGEPTGSSGARGLADWLRWVHETPIAGLDWRDRMFIEQRQAGWLAAKEQVYDLQELERFPLVNSGAISALLLGLPEEARLGSRIQARAVEAIAPALAAPPYNPPDRHFVHRRPDIAAVRILNDLRRRILRRARRLRRV